MVFSNKELIFLSTLPITVNGMLFTIFFTITSLCKVQYISFTLKIEYNPIMLCFIWGLILLTINKIFEVYEERQSRRQNERIL